MTTIAFNGEILAGDTLLTNGSGVHGYAQKVYNIDNTILVGASGSMPDTQESIRKVVSHYLDTEATPIFPVEPLKKTEDTWKVIVIFKDLEGTICVHEWFNHEAPSVDYTYPYGLVALGSGADYALGAMLADKDPIEAIKIASVFDLCTNDQVVAYTVDNLIKRIPNKYSLVAPQTGDIIDD